MPTVRTNDIETYYEERGVGPPVVFIHGAILDHAQWELKVSFLSDEYRTLAYDVRGGDRTGGSARDTYSIDLFADDLDALITGLNPTILSSSRRQYGNSSLDTFLVTRSNRIPRIKPAEPATADKL
ncbi:alpha/beta fold hydrolase [Haladaptatus pallidirubidus]|uniref:AB hydrolase-1 domain-containing protein n=1 Tax=Haladaptatus pallidirubidus TaxID=1008152 RepID=A0AAV3UF61_9EURY|nr:alpha/beta hydrolase [Haladaptatus pallidirubidus]